MIHKDQNVLNFKHNLNEIAKIISSIKQEELAKFNSIINNHSNIILIGNGGSNAIASHISVDYNKFLKKKTIAFTDSSMLTAYFNDYGNKNVYVEYIKQYICDKSLIIFISSSGNSDNIIEGIKFCNKKNINYCLFTGFFIKNKSKKLATKSKNCLFNLWIDSKSYNVVENCHQIFLHSIIIN
jgi:D-sedoheptulose 7-phosphate isomerase